MSFTTDLQIAIYSKINADGTYPVFDAVPQNQPYPFISLGDDTNIPFSTDAKTGFEVTYTIHSWSDYGGRKEIKEMQAKLYELFNRQNLLINGYNVLNVNQEYSESLLEADGIVRHGITRIRIIAIEV